MQLNITLAHLICSPNLNKVESTLYFSKSTKNAIVLRTLSISYFIFRRSGGNEISPGCISSIFVIVLAHYY